MKVKWKEEKEVSTKISILMLQKKHKGAYFIQG